jgi:outer membrane protein assembly factor BamB
MMPSASDVVVKTRACLYLACVLGCCAVARAGTDGLPGSSAGAARFAASGQLVAESDPLPFHTKAVALAGVTKEVDPLDWPYCRGPRFDGVSPETGLPDNWDPEGGPGSNVAWKRDDLGGRSTPIVMQGKLYTIVRADPGTPREGEKVVCLDAKTGETIWENRFNVYLSDVPDTRVGWSSVVGDPVTGRVYAQGVSGHFQCLDAETGQTIWMVPLHERFGMLSTYGGRTNFPIVFEDLVIVSGVIIGWGDMAKPAHRFLGLDKMTGEVRWFNGTTLLPYDTTYSAPSLAVFQGQQALVFGSGDGKVWALQPRTGEHIWSFALSRRGLNSPPLVVGDTVFMGNSEENVSGTTMGAIVALDGNAQGEISEPRWRVDQLVGGRTAPLLIDRQLWVFDDRAKLYILDARTGDQIERVPLGTVMRSSPLYADGKVYALTVNGRWYILRPDPEKGAAVVNKGRLPRGEEVHGSPVCSHGRVYIPTTLALYCLHDAQQEHGVAAIPETPEEAPAGSDPAPAHLQLVPADMLMAPGQAQRLTARLYNARGQFLRVAEAEFKLEGPGQIRDGSEFVAPNAGHVATTLHASAEGLTGTARIRTVPGLPWRFDFEDVPLSQQARLGEPPVTWVGARYRHVVREVDGNKVMVKITTIPKGTRSRCWFGPSHLNNYTIQADVRGASQQGRMPDIGLIAQGYAVDLQGAAQQLQIRTWYPQLRMAQTVNFPWQADAWYTMKLRAETQGDKAVLKAKVWPRDDPEPADWTLVAEDLSPNRSGSPGLFGNAKDAEIFLDDIQVTAN